MFNDQMQKYKNSLKTTVHHQFSIHKLKKKKENNRGCTYTFNLFLLVIGHFKLSGIDAALISCGKLACTYGSKFRYQIPAQKRSSKNLIGLIKKKKKSTFVP